MEWWDQVSESVLQKLEHRNVGVVIALETVIAASYYYKDFYR